MNIEQMIRDMRTARDNLLTLGELILTLEQWPGDSSRDVMFDFGYLYPDGLGSYRGYYDELAIRFTDERGATIGSFLGELRQAEGATFQGYKGGSYEMTSETPLWAANYGEANQTGVIGVDDWHGSAILLTAHVDYLDRYVQEAATTRREAKEEHDE